jgi:hypothetical protein
VWNFRKCAVRHCNAADRKRGPVVDGRPTLAESANFADQLGSHPLGTSQFGKEDRELTRRCCPGKRN